MPDDNRTAATTPPPSKSSERADRDLGDKLKSLATAAASAPAPVDDRASIVTWLRLRTPAEAHDERMFRIRLADQIENLEDRPAPSAE